MSRSPRPQVASTLRPPRPIRRRAALGLTAIAASQAPPHADAATIEEITVIGRYPGPPLWRVSSGEHVLWIFGDLTPVPKGLDWDPRNAERVLDRADGVIGPMRHPRADVQPDQDLPRAARRTPALRATRRDRRSPT